MLTYTKFKDYLTRSGDGYEGLYPAEYVITDERGFCSYDIDGEDLIVWQVYGKGKEWERHLHQVAKENGCKRIVGLVLRNPEVYCRRYNANVIGHIVEQRIVEEE